MSDTAPPTMTSVPTEGDHANESIKQDQAHTAFLELAHDLEPYINDLLWRPIFHQFMDLPIELRYMVYEEYFLNDSLALITKDWPELEWASAYIRNRVRKSKSAPFLPNICLASKFLLSEAGSFLLAAFTFEFDLTGELLYFLEMAGRFQTAGLNALHSIRKLCFTNANGLHLGQLIYFDHRETRKIDMERVKMSSSAINIALNTCHGLQKLYVQFFAPLQHRYRGMPRNLSSVRALSIGQYLGSFNLKSVLRLKRLQTIHIAGVSGRRNLYISDPTNNMTLQADTIENLRPLSDLASKIKAGFRAKGQDVEVQTHLYWGNEEEEHKTME